MIMQISILIDGDEQYGSRFWDQVPRKGDHIMLEGPKEGIYLIESVIWHGDLNKRVILNVTKSK